MKVWVASRTCGPGQRRRKGQEKRKSPDSRSPDRIGMNSARPIPAEGIRCSWEVKECAAMGPVGREAGALAMRWKKRKGKSRAPFGAQGEQGKQARPLEGLVGPRRKRVA